VSELCRSWDKCLYPKKDTVRCSDDSWSCPSDIEKDAKKIPASITQAIIANARKEMARELTEGEEPKVKHWRVVGNYFPREVETVEASQEHDAEFCPACAIRKAGGL
jgi:hypothetical protein